MPQFHQNTKHSYSSVRKNSFFLDWRTQPKNFKRYPHFHQRFKISDYEELSDLNLIGAITFEKEFPEGKYSLRVNPSAGGLYPCEIYLQIRGVKGLLDGLYHYESKNATLVLLHELSDDGVEAAFKEQNKEQGIIFLISSIYFRSSWKYRDRSIRYILLDSGHQLGSIYAAMSVMKRTSCIRFDFDKLSLNELFGFRRDEMMTVSLNSSIKKEKSVKKLRQNLPYVCGCDYLETNGFIEDAYMQSALYESDDIDKIAFFDNVSSSKLKDAILNRRSIRAFRGHSITKSEFEFICEGLFEFASSNNIELFYTIHRVDEMENGLYKSRILQESGDFSQMSRYLSLEQNLGGHGAVTFYFTSDEIRAYQKVNILSGFIAHIIYLRSELKNIGCSGIGAYYDDEAKTFLKTKNNILYLLAIGR